MKTLHSLTPDTRAPRLEAELEGLLNTLFSRWPALIGFSIREQGELHLADVAIHPWSGQDEASRLGGDIAAALAELVEAQPAAHELLGGRTFARTLQ